MEENFDEQENPEGIEQQNFLLYTEKDFLLNEVLAGLPITVKHEQAILQKTVEEIDELPSIIINRTKGNILHYKYAMEEFADLKLSENYFKMYLNPREWNPEKLYLNHEINHDVDRKRRQLCINLNETIANQQSLCWEFIPRMKILKAYIGFLQDQNKKLETMLDLHKDEKKERKQLAMETKQLQQAHTSAALQKDFLEEEPKFETGLSPLTTNQLKSKGKKVQLKENPSLPTKRKRGRPKKQKLTGSPEAIPQVHTPLENQFPFPKPKKPVEDKDEFDEFFEKDEEEVGEFKEAGEGE